VSCVFWLFIEVIKEMDFLDEGVKKYEQRAKAQKEEAKKRMLQKEEQKRYAILLSLLSFIL
jgi:hypothetical protein